MTHHRSLDTVTAMDLDDDLTWLEDLEIDYRVGNCLDADADAVVAPFMTGPTTYGSVSREIFDRHRVALQDSIASLLDSRPDHRFGWRQAAALPDFELAGGQKVIIVAWWDQVSPYTETSMKLSLLAALRAAVQLEEAGEPVVRHLALSIFATEGRHGALARAVAGALEEFDGLKNSRDFALRRLTFYSTTQETLDHFMELLEMAL